MSIDHEDEALKARWEMLGGCLGGFSDDPCCLYRFSMSGYLLRHVNADVPQTKKRLKPFPRR